MDSKSNSKYFTVSSSELIPYMSFLNLQKCIEFIGKKYNSQIEGRNSHIKKGIKKIIFHCEINHNCNMSVREIKFLFGSKREIWGHGQYLKISKQIPVIFNTICELLEQDRYAINYLVRYIPEDSNEALYRDLLIEKIFKLIYYYRTNASQPDIDVIEIYNLLRDNIKSLHKPLDVDAKDRKQAKNKKNDKEGINA